MKAKHGQWGRARPATVINSSTAPHDGVLPKSGAKTPRSSARRAEPPKDAARGASSRKDKGPLESAIQKSIMDWLKTQSGVFAERCNTGVAMLPGAGGKMRPVTFGTVGGPDIRLTVLRPISMGDGGMGWDLLIGQSAAVEVKRADGVQSQAQKNWQIAFESVGGKYVVCRSLEDAMAFVDSLRSGR